MSPSNTRWTASASGTRSTVMSASSCSTMKPSGRSTVGEPLGQVDVHQLVAEPGRAVDVDQQRPALGGELASSASSRFAVSSGGSPSASRRPAGSSQRCRPTGCRYCRSRTTRSSSSSATTATAPGCCDDLADAVAAAGHRDGVPAQRDDPALVDRLAVAATVGTRARAGVRRRRSASDADLLAPRRDPAPAAARPPGSRSPPARTPRTAGAAGSGGSSAPGGPGCRRRTGAPRAAARRTRPAGRPATCRRRPGRPRSAGRGRRC